MWKYNENELYHYGVKGMRWGVRRDRSSVNLGKAKKKTEAAGRIVNESRNINNTVSKTKLNKARRQSAKAASQMSDKELRDRVNRLNMEQQYVNLTTNQMNAGRANVDRVLSNVGTAIAVTNSAIGIAMAIKQLKG